MCAPPPYLEEFPEGPLLDQCLSPSTSSPQVTAATLNICWTSKCASTLIFYPHMIALRALREHRFLLQKSFDIVYHGVTLRGRCVVYLGLHLVVADELSVASAGFDQVVVVAGLQDFAILQNQNVIAELQELQRHDEYQPGADKRSTRSS